MAPHVDQVISNTILLRKSVSGRLHPDGRKLTVQSSVNMRGM